MTETTNRTRCTAHYANGNACRSYAVDSDDRCRQHQVPSADEQARIDEIERSSAEFARQQTEQRQAAEVARRAQDTERTGFRLV